MQENGRNDKKIIAIINCIQDCRLQLNKLAKAAYPKKFIFRKIERRPIKRISKLRATSMMMIVCIITVFEILKIINQPEPKFLKGAIAGNNQPEIY